MKSKEDQIKAIKKIMSKHDIASYLIHGETYHKREELKKFGCYWDSAYRKWRTPNIKDNDILFDYCDNNDFRLEVIKRIKLI